jgi:hypothetical protein
MKKASRKKIYYRNTKRREKESHVHYLASHYQIIAISLNWLRKIVLQAR